MSDVIYMSELAKMLGKTEGAIRSAVQQRRESVPPSFKLGGKHAWRRIDVESWIEARKNENHNH